MTREDYARVLGFAHAVRLQARQLAVGGQLEDAIAAVDHADALGPVLDPTAYRDNATAMLEDREVLAAVRDLAHIGGAPS